VLQYLGRYTHRVAISNHRLVSFVDGQVTFLWRDSAHNNEQKPLTLSLDKFFTPLPAAYSSARVCAYPALRFPSLPTAPHDLAPILPVVGCGTRSAYRRRHFLHRRRSGSLSLSQVWRTNEGHRTAHRCRNPTSFSTSDQLCGMKRLSPTPTLRALLRATPLSASSKNEFLHARSATTVFTTPFHSSHFLGPRFDGSCSAAQLRRTSKPSLPTFEFAEGPRPPQPPAATS
jgi:Putative transposase